MWLWPVNDTIELVSGMPVPQNKNYTVFVSPSLVLSLPLMHYNKLNYSKQLQYH
jgi:hypothetical protein